MMKSSLGVCTFLSPSVPFCSSLWTSSWVIVFSFFLAVVLWLVLILLCSSIGRELSKKAKKANNIWWRVSGLLGDQNRLFMYILLQAVFTLATTALTVPIFLSYKLHVVFQVLKVSASIWNGGNFMLDVMPRQVILKEEKKKSKMPTVPDQNDQTSLQESAADTNNASETVQSE